MADEASKKGLRTWIEIDAAALRSNAKAFRSILDEKTKLMGVVKSNAYGHGLVDFSKLLVEAGADWLGVDSVVEGLRLREEGITLPILVLGYTLPAMIMPAVLKDLSLSVSHFGTLEAIEKLAERKSFLKRSRFTSKLTPACTARVFW